MTPFLEPLLHPIGILWLLHFLAAVFMARHRKWREAIFCASLTAAIWVVGSTRLPAQLLACLERPYAKRDFQQLPHCDAVVMLGGTLNASSGDLFGFDLGEPADRIVTAIELFKRNLAGTLILGGGGGKSSSRPGGVWSEGEVMKPWLAKLGVSGTNVFPLHNCSNTRDEALEVAALAKERKWQRILLVTSAYHMKRASALFARLGIPFEPAPCDFVGLSTLENQRRFSPFPRSGGFHQLELFLHEWIGWQYYRLRGWVESDPGESRQPGP